MKCRHGFRYNLRTWLYLLTITGSSVLLGCDGLLDVELPGQVTEPDLYEPSQARLLVNSAIADIECAISDFIATDAGGNEDVFIRVTGWWGGAHEFRTSPNTTECNSAENAYGWWTPLHKGRMQAERTYKALGEWDVSNKEQLLAQSAIYAGVAYEMLGEHFCEIAVDNGPLMSPDETLAIAENYFTSALDHIERAGGDFPMVGEIATSARQMAHLLRARVRYARADQTGALSDVEQVGRGFVAYVTRESGGQRTRWNRVVNSHNGAAWNSILGPVDWWKGPGSWPAVIPYTGYQDLGILPDGRALTGSRNAITTKQPGAVPDLRVPVINRNSMINGYPWWQQQKYTSLDDDFPLANWEEAWLLAAEIEGGQAAIDRVNQIRAFHHLPLITYLSSGDTQAIEEMIIEERRRSLFLEGRFWFTKIVKDLWFPRGTGVTPYPYPYHMAVRMTMPDLEYELNPNLNPSQKGSLCGNQRPAI